jgi:hypothetical protein
MGDSAEQQRKPEATAETKAKLGVADPEVSRAGLLDGVWERDLGEHVIGSGHVFNIDGPLNRSDTDPVVVSVVVDGSSAFSMSFWGATVPPRQRGANIPIAFAPDHEGAYQATLTYVAQWQNGHTERKQVKLSARARKLDAAPEGAAVATVKPAPTANDAPDQPGTKLVDTRDLSKFEPTLHAQTLLVARQSAGVDDVEKEAATFKPPPAPVSIWGELADLAIIMGTAGIAAVVGKFVAEELYKTVKGPATHASHGAPPSHEGERTLSAHAAPSERGALAIDGIATSVEDGIKHSVEEHVGHHEEPKADGETGDGSDSGSGNASTQDAGQRGSGDDQRGSGSRADPVSADRSIAFFSSQREMIGNAGDTSYAKLNEMLASLMDRHPPQLAHDIMDGIRSAFKRAAASAEAKQAQATTSQWLAYTARLGIGQETVKTANGDRAVTKLASQREHESPLQLTGLANGVLQIDVSRNSEKIRPQSARLYGIANTTAERLRGMNLRNSGVPIRFVVNGWSVVTLDEAGRVRSSGPNLTPEHSEPGDMEAANNMEAERIVQVVLEKSLKAWGIDKITTNDTSTPQR